MGLTVTLKTSGLGVGGNITTASMTIAAGTIAIALGWEETTAILSVVDSDARAFTVVQQASTDRSNAAVAYYLNHPGGTNKTITVTFVTPANMGYGNYQVYNITGWAATPEVAIDSAKDAATGTAVSSGAAHATQTESARIAAAGNFNGYTYTSPAFGGGAADGFYPNGNYYVTWDDTWDSSDPGDISATATQDYSYAWACVQVVFEKAAGGALDQEGFRFRNDDGDEASASWLASQDTNITAPLDTNTRVRFIVDGTGDPAATQFQLEAKLSTDSDWFKVT
jgi:hypothetical protein